MTSNSYPAHMDLYQQYIAISRYARWRDDLGRREVWSETVERLIKFWKGRTESHLDLHPVLDQIQRAIVNLEVTPSMRTLMTAGEALERENVAGFNCAYAAIDSKRTLPEVLYILMCGTGVGFSCERQAVASLPPVPETVEPGEGTIVVADSKRGWAKAYSKLLNSLWEGDIPTVDYHKVRPAGARLKVFGGRASGPAPLKELFDFTVATFQRAAGRRLTSLEVHDLACKIGDIVVVGGVRRSALISLSNLSDMRMRDAKSGNWRATDKQRELANNSVAYTEKPSAAVFFEEWLALMRSGSGERGIFNRVASQKQAARWGRRSADAEYGTNPCSEIILLSKQFCNLSEAVVRATDTFEDIKRKVEQCAVLGTLQSTLTDFGFLSESWKTNTEKECLLGVSLTGIMDNALLNGSEDPEGLPARLEALRDHARATNKKWAAYLGIPESAAITCVKPSGTVSQLVNSASGIHPRHNRNYLRTVRVDKKDPLYHFQKAKGFYIEDAVGNEGNIGVVYFPMRAPVGARVRDEVPALEMLELWLTYQRHWCEHKPSITISVKEEEWADVAAWVYRNFDEVSGISFLPHFGGNYAQLPYQDMTEEELAAWEAKHPTPEVDWRELAEFEKEDNTVSSQTLACTGGSCELPNT